MSTYSHNKPVLDTYQAVVSAFAEFLTVAIHTILYERNIYPRTSFLSARKYNYPVRQNRHPKVCQWIQDAVAAVEIEMLKSTISTTSLIIHSPSDPLPISQSSPAPNTPLERFVFSTSFPAIPSSEILTPFTISLPNASDHPTSASATADPTDHPLNPTDLTEQFRSLLSRLSHLSSTLSPLPENCTFTVAIELKDGAEAPIRKGKGGGEKHKEEDWVVALPERNEARRSNTRPGDSEAEPRDSKVTQDQKSQKQDSEPFSKAHPRYTRTTPLRAVSTGPFGLELWVEESQEKVSIS